MPNNTRAEYAKCYDCAETFHVSQMVRKRSGTYVCKTCEADKPVKNAVKLKCLKCGKAFRSRDKKIDRLCYRCQVENTTIVEVGRYGFGTL